MDVLTPWAYDTAESITLRGYRTPERGKPLLHFIHGNGFCGMMYEPLWRGLVDDYDLFLSDVEGHGDSDHSERFPGWDATGWQCREVMEAHCQRDQHPEIIGMGHSFGAILTLLLAAQDHKLFDRVVVLDPVLFSPNMIHFARLLAALKLTPMLPLARQAKVRGRFWPNRDAAYDYFHERGMLKGWHADALNAYLDHVLHHDEQGLTLKCPPQREADIFASVPVGIWRYLKKLQTPTTIIYGDASYPFVESSIERLRGFNPQVDAIKVPGGHCFMQQYPQDTLNVLKQVLAAR